MMRLGKKKKKMMDGKDDRENRWKERETKNEK